MENDLFAEAYAKEVVHVVKTTIRCLTTVLRGSKFYLKIYSNFFFVLNDYCLRKTSFTSF